MGREGGHPYHVPHREGGMDAHGYGVEIEICSENPLPPPVVEELLRRTVTEIAESCVKAGAKAIGHIKCYLKTGEGYAKADIVRLKQGAYAEIRLESPMTSGRLVINSILLGLPEAVVEEVTLTTIRRLLTEYGITLVSQEDGHGDH